MSEGIGSKRLVTGAHYGLRDWMAQRLTAVLMALFTALVLFQLIFSRGEIGYDLQAGRCATGAAYFHDRLVALMFGLGGAGSLETLTDDTFFYSPSPF